ncbi:MAG: hypothetical protein E6J38_05330 [Chloroflexi bacterium]|nr:MAG: hypothetical protein E6J38_05330 [Chloroflexota bacterium]
MLDPLAIIASLTRHDVHFVVIGGIAAALHGSTTLTADLDVLYEREQANVSRLSSALAELGAQRRDLPDRVTVAVDERSLWNGTNFLFTTRHGDLECIGETPSGRFTYAQIAAGAERFDLGDGLVVRAASLDELIRMKRAASRAKDNAEVENLVALREVRDAKRR